MRLNPGDIVIGRYEIIKRLGQGGFGTTYKAYDKNQSPHPILVLKQIRIAHTNHNEAKRDPDYIRRLRLEADTLRNLQHPCIPEFYNSFEEGNYYYIVQEYIEGHNLSEEIRPGEPIEEEEAESILREILEILQFVHGNNIIHRDVKPANIIRRRSNGRLYLIDFGAVKEIVTEHTSNSGILLTKAIVSQGYTPVEQSDGKPKLNSDIYALGITIMRAVTGFSINSICDPDRSPQRDNDCNYIWHNHAPKISYRLKEIISKMIRYNFKNRYQSVDEILQDLDQEPPPVIDNEPEEKPPTIPNPNGYQKTIRYIILISAALLSIILFKTFEKYYILPRIFFSTLNDNISSGEEILDPLSKGSIRLKAAQQYKEAQKYIALPKYKQNKYQEALEDYQLSWQKERRDAESLIYLNNALLEASKADYYTIAVAVPLSSHETPDINNSALAQNFLRGIAQAQTEINLSLPDANHSTFKQLSGLGILKSKQISENTSKGLKVIIVDDGNNLEQAQQAAKNIAKVPNLLGVVGHYASEITLATVDIYNQNNIPQISFGSTSNRLSTNHRDNFFRSVYTNNEEAETIIKYIESINSSQIKVAGFYNPESDYSNYLWIEIRDRLKQKNIPIVKEFNIADQSFNTHVALKELDNKGANVYVLLPDGQVTNSLSNAIQVIKQDNGNSFIVGGNSIVRPRVKRLSTTNPLNISASIFWHPLSSPNLKFVEESKQLWQGNIENGTAITYDATLALIKAIQLQTKPSRKGTIKELSNPEFQVKNGATGNIKFNTPENGDRLNYYPTLVRLHQCEDGHKNFVPLSTDQVQASMRSLSGRFNNEQ